MPPIDLDDALHLPTAAMYPFPEDASAVIPTVYGGFLSSLVVPADEDDGGFLPATSIDRLLWIWALNSLPVHTQTPKIYINETLQDPSVYIFEPAVDYGGIGRPIAAVRFLVNPGTRKVSWRGHGTRDPTTAALITNPLVALYNAFSTYGGWTLNDFDLGLAYETFRTLTDLGVEFRWVFAQQDRTYREWLTESLKTYFVDHFITEAGKLGLKLDRAIYGLPVTVLHTIDAQTDLEGTEDDVEYESDEQNFVNVLTVKRRYQWTTGEYTDEPTVEFTKSSRVYGLLREEIELPGLYTDADGVRFVQAFFGRYAFLPTLVRFTVRGLGFTPALPGTDIGFISPWMGWTEARLLKVLNQEVDPFEQRISFECLDTGRFVTDAVTLPSVAMTPVRRRIRVPTPTVDLTPPAAASNLVATGSYRRIVLRWTAPGDLDYSHTEIWAAFINIRAAAQLIRTGGNGVAPGGPCEESVEVVDGASGYIWLMTVDRSGNGRNGTGNWYPASPTAGIFATATTIPTVGLAPNAVSDQYPSTFAFNGLMTGPIGIASAFAPTSPQEGYFTFHGIATIQVSSLCTLVMEIRQGSISGPVSGQLIFSNILLTTGTYPFVVQGKSTSPVWGGEYGVVAQVLNQSGAQVPFVVSGSGFELSHVKR